MAIQSVSPIQSKRPLEIKNLTSLLGIGTNTSGVTTTSNLPSVTRTETPSASKSSFLSQYGIPVSTAKNLIQPKVIQPTTQTPVSKTGTISAVSSTPTTMPVTEQKITVTSPTGESRTISPTVLNSYTNAGWTTTTPTRPITPAPSMLTDTSTTTAQTPEELQMSIIKKALKQQYGDTLTDAEANYIAQQQIQQSQASSQYLTEFQQAQQAQLDKLAGLTAQQEADYKARQAELEAQNAKILDQYKASQEAQAQEAKTLAQKYGTEQQATTERLLGGKGNLTSTVGTQAIGVIQDQTNQTLNSINAAKNANIALKEAELRGASKEELDVLSGNLAQAKQAEAEAILTSENALQQAKLDALQAGDTARQTMLQNALDQLSAQKVKSKADATLTKNINDGYIYDEYGQKVKDAEGNFITYDNASELDLLTVSPGTVVIDKNTGMPVYQAPEKAGSNIQTIGGVTYTTDASGNLVPFQAPGATTQAVTQAKQTISLIDNILNNPKLDAVVGAKGISNYIPGTEAQTVKNEIDKLIGSLVLDERGKLKGSGAISDFETRLIQQSATDLGTNLSNESFKQKLGEIRTRFENVEKTSYLSQATGLTQDEAALQLENIKQSAGRYPSLDELQQAYPSFKSESQTSLNGSNQAVLQSVTSEYKAGEKGGQCTTFLHSLVDFPSIGDGLNAKKASVDKIGIPKEQWNPQVGDVVVTSDNPTYGHTYMILALQPNNKAVVIDSNWKGDEKIRYREVDLTDNKIYGAIRGNLKLTA